MNGNNYFGNKVHQQCTNHLQIIKRECNSEIPILEEIKLCLRLESNGAKSQQSHMSAATVGPCEMG